MTVHQITLPHRDPRVPLSMEGVYQVLSAPTTNKCYQDALTHQKILIITIQAMDDTSTVLEVRVDNIGYNPSKWVIGTLASTGEPIILLWMSYGVLTIQAYNPEWSIEEHIKRAIVFRK